MQSSNLREYFLIILAVAYLKNKSTNKLVLITNPRY